MAAKPINIDDMNGIWVVYTNDSELVGVFTTKEKCQNAVNDLIEKQKSNDGFKVWYTTLNYVPGHGKFY